MGMNQSYRALAGKIERAYRDSIESTKTNGIKGVMSAGQIFPYSIPCDQGGVILVNRECYFAICDFGAKWRLWSERTLKHRITQQAAHSLAIRAFSSLLKSGQDSGDSESLVGAMLRKLSEFEKSWTVKSFNFPCALTQSPAPTQLEKFDIGPVRFSKKEAWVGRLNRGESQWIDALASKLSGLEVSKELAKHESKDLSDALRVLGAAAWVAEVSIEKHHPESAAEKAKLLYRLAMLVIGATLPLAFVNEMDLSEAPISSVRRVWLQGRPEAKLQVAGQVSWKGKRWIQAEFDDWMDRCSDFFRAAGRALDRLAAPNTDDSIREPAGRWLDGLLAFGTARQSVSPAFSVVNYGIALDTLTLGGKARGIVALLSALYAIQADGRFLRDGTTLEDFVERLYNAGRSRYSHGSSSLLLDETPVAPDTADNVVSLTLINYIIQLDKSEWKDSIEDFQAWLQSKSLANASSP